MLQHRVARSSPSQYYFNFRVLVNFYEDVTVFLVYKPHSLKASLKAQNRGRGLCMGACLHASYGVSLIIGTSKLGASFMLRVGLYT